MIDDILELGYDVDDVNSEYVLISIEDNDGELRSLKVLIGGTSRTMYLDFKRAHEL